VLFCLSNYLVRVLDLSICKQKYFLFQFQPWLEQATLSLYQRLQDISSTHFGGKLAYFSNYFVTDGPILPDHRAVALKHLILSAEADN